MNTWTKVGDQWRVCCPRCGVEIFLDCFTAERDKGVYCFRGGCMEKIDFRPPVESPKEFPSGEAGKKPSATCAKDGD